MARTEYELNALAQSLPGYHEDEHGNVTLDPIVGRGGSRAELLDMAEEDFIVNLSAVENVYVHYLTRMLRERYQTTEDKDEETICRKLLCFINSVQDFVYFGIDAPWSINYHPAPGGESHNWRNGRTAGIPEKDLEG